MRDRRILYLTCFLRAVATQMLGVQLGLYLPAAGLSEAQRGAVLSAGLSGAAIAALLATLLADARGRRRLLTEVALLGAVGASGAVFGLLGWDDLFRVSILVGFGLLMWRIAIRAMTKKLID